MAQYCFVTTWRLRAPIEAVWNIIYDTRNWPSWWSYVERVVELEPGDKNGLSCLRRFTWKTRLPYTLTFDSRTVRVERPFLIEATVSGELDGRGRWLLSREGETTTVRYEWNVYTRKPWMNLLAGAARPVFKWNHDAVMRQGGQGLARLLGVQLQMSD